MRFEIRIGIRVNLVLILLEMVHKGFWGLEQRHDLVVLVLL